MKDYELSILFHPDLEMNLDPALDKIKSLIEANKGKIVKEERNSKKRLAYAIAGQEFAVYYYFDVQLPATAPTKMSNVLNITDEVIRYLLAKTDERKAKMEAKREARKSSDEEVEETE